MSSPTITPNQTDRLLQRVLGDDLQRATLLLVAYIAVAAFVLGGFFWLLG